MGSLYSKPRSESGWADAVELGPGVWQFTVGYFAESGREVIWERRSCYRSEKQSTDAMDAAWKRMQKAVPELNSPQAMED